MLLLETWTFCFWQSNFRQEMSAVLANLGGGLSDEECKQLFDALDKDGNGKLTCDEFIDYVFGTEVSGSQKKLLGDGFGLNGLAGETLKLKLLKLSGQTVSCWVVTKDLNLGIHFLG